MGQTSALPNATRGGQEEAGTEGAVHTLAYLTVSDMPSKHYEK
jgi:hypothetical protein